MIISLNADNLSFLLIKYTYSILKHLHKSYLTTTETFIEKETSQDGNEGLRDKAFHFIQRMIE